MNAPVEVEGAVVERIAALLHEEATGEPWTVAGVEHDGPDRDYFREVAGKVAALAAHQAPDDREQAFLRAAAKVGLCPSCGEDGPCTCRGGRILDAIDADNGLRLYPWTYTNQPGNVGAGALGDAARLARPGGDSIDYGLSLLFELHLRGLGIVRVPKLGPKKGGQS